MPKLLPGLELYWTAYMELQSDRPIGMSAGPIPYSSIIRWAEINGLSDLQDITVLIQHLRAMEAADREFEQENKGAK